MNKFLLAAITALSLLMLPAVSHAAIIGQPFLPESDARFDAIEGNSTIISAPGNHQKQTAVATYDFAVQGGSSAAAISLPVTLPNGAIIIRDYVWVDSALTAAAGPAATLSFGCGAVGNILAATNMIGAPASIPFDGVSTGASAVFKQIGAPCNIQANIATNNLTAGKVTAYIDYVVHP